MALEAVALPQGAEDRRQKSGVRRKSRSFAEFTLSNAEGLRMTARRAVNPSRDREGADKKTVISDK